jgi:fructokinase
VRRAKIVHASTFALSREPCRSAVQKAFRLATEYGKIISLDPNYSFQIWPDRQEGREVLQMMLGYVTVTKPSLDDAKRLLGDGGTPQSYIEAFHDMGPTVVVLTMGAEGVLLSDKGKLTHIPARPVKVVDATGAGDAFWAGYLVALLDGHSLHRCALFAREVVERKLTTVGPLPDAIDRSEVYKLVDSLAAAPTA